MKSFKQMKDTIKNIVKKIDGIQVVFTQVAGGVKVTIDGSELDTYPDQRRAEKMANEFVKLLRIKK
jgi:RNase P/RNase MRP subunit p29